jgi:signal transduction histidine kinase/AmiR/NasT family two-component response regulator
MISNARHSDHKNSPEDQLSEGKANVSFPVIDAEHSKIVTGLEHMYDSAIISIDSNGRLKYFTQNTITLFQLKPSLIHAGLNIKTMLTYLARRGDFGLGDATALAAIAAQALYPVSHEDNNIAQTYLTMPSGAILRVMRRSHEDGTVTLAAYDVSEQRRKENMLEMALNIGFAGYLTFDLLKSSCHVESRYLKKLLTAEETHSLEETGPSSLFHSDDLIRSKQMWETVRDTGEKEEGTLRIVTKNHGVRWLKFVLIPESEAPNANRIIAFFNDVTDVLRQQENLRKAKRLAEESLSSKENFLARMSHEIRTPMNAVIGMSDALIHHNPDPTVTPQLELIQKSAGNILRLLDETLTHSRLDNDGFSLDPNMSSPAEVVGDVCALWEQQALKNNSTIRCVIKETVPDEVYFDKFRYEQCANNLLSNAVKFTHGGMIDVMLTCVEKDGGGPHLVLAVKDTGIGMTKEQQSRIFDAYKQADETISSRFGGTGLGMNITKQIIERMGGTISVRSQIGSGSMFAMSVPITSESLESEEAFQDAVIQSQGQVDDKQTVQIATEIEQPPIDIIESKQEKSIEPEGITSSTNLIDHMLTDAKPEVTAYSELRILVVDDNPTNHLVLKSLLGSIVSEIMIANNGTEALDILDTIPVDIVLMDIHMPIMDGIECTLAIRGSDKPWRDVTIIALTADPQYQQKKLCKNIGMDEALGKPVRLTEILEAIDTVRSDNDSPPKVESNLAM